MTYEDQAPKTNASGLYDAIADALGHAVERDRRVLPRGHERVWPLTIAEQCTQEYEDSTLSPSPHTLLSLLINDIITALHADNHAFNEARFRERVDSLVKGG